MENLVKMQAANLSETYRGKRVFLTGHTGFKGAWLLSWLHLIGAEVKGYALAPEQAEDLYNTINGDQLCHSVLADIRDQERLCKELVDFQPDFIFHLAAQPLVRRSYEVPAYTYEVNLLGTVYLLDAIRALDNPCVVLMITTDKVYENREWHYPYRETDRLGGYDPYSASKACAELAISSYRNAFFNPSGFSTHGKTIAVARAGNVIGGGDWAQDRIIPDIVRALDKGKPVNIRNPLSVRPWQHVLEPLGGYLLLGANLAEMPLRFDGAWNFGPYISDTLSVTALAELAITHWGAGNLVFSPTAPSVHEAGLLKLEISKAIVELGWRPKYSAAEAVSKTIDWYSNFLSGKDALSLVKSDIQSYLNV